MRVYVRIGGLSEICRTAFFSFGYFVSGQCTVFRKARFVLPTAFKFPCTASRFSETHKIICACVSVSAAYQKFAARLFSLLAISFLYNVPYFEKLVLYCRLHSNSLAQLRVFPKHIKSYARVCPYRRLIRNSPHGFFLFWLFRFCTMYRISKSSFCIYRPPREAPQDGRERLPALLLPL